MITRVKLVLTDRAGNGEIWLGEDEIAHVEIVPAPVEVTKGGTLLAIFTRAR